MPKTFSESEREIIKERLMEEAEKCISLYGIKKTTVDEIVKRAGIPKGTFYLFYESKEALVFDIFLRLNQTIQQKLLENVSAMQGKPDAETLTETIFQLYQSLDGSFLLKIMENGEIEWLIRKAPRGFIEANMADDDLMVGQLMALIPDMDTEKSEIFSGALRGVFLAMMHKDKIANEHFDEVLRTMVRGIVIQMFGG